MKCPFCGDEESKVIDSRSADDGERIRRRRECMKCMQRFTTYEMIETIPIIVVKKNKSCEVFNRDKILSGLLKACEKRQVSIEELEKIVDSIEQRIQNSLKKEIDSKLIGEYAMDALKKVDEVAYVRFASVYRQFKDINTFKAELEKIINQQEANK